MSKMRSVTILVDVSLEKTICEKLRAWGAVSYIVTESRISGPALPRQESHEIKRVRIEAIVSEDVASRIIQGLQAESFNDCSLSFFVSEVLTLAGTSTIAYSQERKQASREERWGDYLITV